MKLFWVALCRYKYVELKFRVSDRPCDLEFEGSCYLLLSERQTFAGALSRCEELGGHLPVIESSQQNTAVANTARGVFHAYRAFTQKCTY